MSMTLAEIQNRLLKLEAQQVATAKIAVETSKHLAYYWVTPRRKVIAIVSRLKKDLADLVVISSGWSGGFSIVDESPMFIEDSTLPDDQQEREGKWEPVIEIPEILDAVIEAYKAAKEAERGQESATAANTTAA